MVFPVTPTQPKMPKIYLKNPAGKSRATFQFDFRILFRDLAHPNSALGAVCGGSQSLSKKLKFKSQKERQQLSCDTIMLDNAEIFL